jgi:hypothetical protein
MHINCMHSAGAVFDFDRLGLGSRAEGGAVVPAFCVGVFFFSKATGALCGVTN